MMRPHLLRMVLSMVYSMQSRKGWSLMTEAPDCLNIAMPDFSSSYAFSSFRSKDKIVFHGECPPCVYASLTLYDTRGAVVSHRRLTPAAPFMVRVGKDVALPSSSTYCVIFRLYKPTTKWDLPSIIQNGKMLSNPSKVSIRNTSQSWSGTLRRWLSRLLHRKLMHGTVIVPDHLDGYFPNPDCSYVVATPYEKGVVVMEGDLPPRSMITYMGFMTCNLADTSTDASLSWDDLPEENHYKIYAAPSVEEALRRGWKEGEHGLLLWKGTNHKPIVVVRILTTTGQSPQEVGMDGLMPTFLFLDENEEEKMNHEP